MKCTLMNKNTEVLYMELSESSRILEVLDLYKIEFAPVVVYDAFNNKSASVEKSLNEWMRHRSVPSWRKDLENLLKSLSVTSPEELLNKSYGLSLSDQYWIKPNDTDLKWDDINFFTHDWDFEAYFDVSIGSHSKHTEISLRSPNNVTDGMLQKAWIIEDGKRMLVKGSYYQAQTEPLNEWLASQISERLGFDYCNYEVDIKHKKLVSKCENFISEDEELVPAWQILKYSEKSNNENEFQQYIRLLNEKGISDARESVTNMFFVDYLIGNFDRHLNNFGIIRDVNTLQWKKVAPIYDCGEAMCCDVSYTPDVNISKTKVRFFSRQDMPIEKLKDKLDFVAYDLSMFTGFTEEYHRKIIEYKDYLNYDDEKFRRTLFTFSTRIKDYSYNYDVVACDARKNLTNAEEEYCL